MKNIFLTAALLACFSLTLAAQDAIKKTDVQAGGESKTKICIVSGEETEGKLTYTHEDKEYAFCCAMCVTKFKENPDKYTASDYVPGDGHDDSGCGHHGDHKHGHKSGDASGGSEKAVKVVNTVCPVGGNPVKDGGGTYEYKGKLYGFCCPGCITPFKKDPEKYIKNL